MAAVAGAVLDTPATCLTPAIATHAVMVLLEPVLTFSTSARSGGGEAAGDAAVQAVSSAASLVSHSLSGNVLPSGSALAAFALACARHKPQLLVDIWPLLAGVATLPGRSSAAGAFPPAEAHWPEHRAGQGDHLFDSVFASIAVPLIACRLRAGDVRGARSAVTALRAVLQPPPAPAASRSTAAGTLPRSRARRSTSGVPQASPVSVSLVACEALVDCCCDPAVRQLALCDEVVTLLVSRRCVPASALLAAAVLPTLACALADTKQVSAACRVLRLFTTDGPQPPGVGAVCLSVAKACFQHAALHAALTEVVALIQCRLLALVELVALVGWLCDTRCLSDAVSVVDRLAADKVAVSWPIEPMLRPLVTRAGATGAPEQLAKVV